MSSATTTFDRPPAPSEPTADLFAPDAQYLARRTVSNVMGGLIGAAAILGVAVLWIILGYLLIQGIPALNWSFFTDRPLPYGEPGGGVGPALLGSLLILALASLIGVPLGMGAGIYLSEFGRGRYSHVVRFCSDLVAGLPSIVVGVFVWSLLVRHLVGHFSGVAGAVALAVIMVPVVVRTVEEVLRLVPHSLREGAMALGVPTWKVVLRVVVPSARAGIITGVVLSMARAGGETAPLLLTTLGNQFFNWNLWQPTAALPVQIYNYAVSPYDDWHQKAFGGSVVLIAVIGLLSIVTRLATRTKRSTH